MVKSMFPLRLCCLMVNLPSFSKNDHGQAMKCISAVSKALASFIFVVSHTVLYHHSDPCPSSLPSDAYRKWCLPHIASISATHLSKSASISATHLSKSAQDHMTFLHPRSVRVLATCFCFSSPG